MISDRVRRTADAILERLLAFESGDVSLSRVASDVEDLITFLGGEPEVDQEWVDELRSHWWQFEFVNSVTVTDGRQTLNDEEAFSLRDASLQLQLMLRHDD